MYRFILGLTLWCLTSHAQADHPAVWAVKGRHNTLYLVGTMHYLPRSEAMPDSFSRAYAESEKVLMELDMDDLNPLDAQQTMMELGLLPEDRTLEQELGAKNYAELKTKAATVGLAAEMLDRFQPWLAAMTLEQMQLIKLGMDAASGTEQQLVAKAGSDGKEIRGLETLEEQLQLFAGLDRTKQREFLMYTLEEMDQSENQLQSILKAWRSGDTATLGKLLEDGMDHHPDLYRALTTDRNRRWISTLTPLLQQSSDDYLVAVGALHLVGDDSVVDLLERAGYDVRRQ